MATVFLTAEMQRAQWEAENRRKAGLPTVGSKTFDTIYNNGSYIHYLKELPSNPIPATTGVITTTGGSMPLNMPNQIYYPNTGTTTTPLLQHVHPVYSQPDEGHDNGTVWDVVAVEMMREQAAQQIRDRSLPTNAQQRIAAAADPEVARLRRMYLELLRAEGKDPLPEEPLEEISKTPVEVFEGRNLQDI